MNIAVVGEGVIGTSAALAIRRAFFNSNITVFSDRNFAETTSYGPAGIFRIDLPEASRWAVESFAFWAQLEKHQSAHKTGVHLISGYCQSDDKSWLESQERAMAGIVYNWKWLTNRELHALFVKPNSHGVHYSTYAAEGRLYVPWLRAQLVAESAPGLLQFRRQRVDSLQELVDSGQFSLVLNCAGLDGGRLAGDDGTSVYPNRGVGLEVEAPGHAHFTYWGRNVFCIPLVSNGHLLIGTIREDNCWSLEVTARDQQTIWTRFIDLQPNFKDAKIVSSWCGLRPNRHGGVRLEHHLRSKSDGNGEKRVHVIHNYGHNSNAINEIAKNLELKYRDFVPSYICLADCQEKIQLALQNGKESVLKLEVKLANAEKEIVKLKDGAPHKELEVVQDFVDRLDILNEMERCLNALWLMPADSKMEFDPLANTRIILRLEELCVTLESESSNYLESINERILPLLFTEIQTRKGELSQQLSEFYASFVRFNEDDRVSPPLYLMNITCPSIKIASDCFSAMCQLGLLDERVEEMVDIVWEHFCLKLIYGVAVPDSSQLQQDDSEGCQLLKVQTNKFAERSVRIGIVKDVEMSKKPDPAAVFSALSQFFGSLYTALKGIRADNRSLVDLFGESISGQLIGALEKGCLGPAIPFEKHEASHVYEQLTKLSQGFLEFMQDKGFFARPVDHLFGNFFDSFERISVDRRCHHFITTARELIKQPYIELVAVGSALDTKEEKSTDIMHKMEEKLRIKVDDEDANLPMSTKWDKYYTKIFQFQRCQISKSTFKLVNVLHDVLRTAAETDSEMEASRLVTTARNILEMFVNTAPEYHRLTLSSVPHMAAVFFNNCHYILHRLTTLSSDVLQNILQVSKITGQDCAFTDMFTQLRTLAATTLEQHIVQARRQLSATIGEGDLFVGLRDDKAHKRCVKVLNGCVMQLEQTASVWREVLSSFVLTHCVGELVSHLLATMVDIILAKEDIASSDAETSADLLTTLSGRCEQLMEIDEQPTIQRVCEEPYHKLQQIIFCLKANLAEIGHQWCEGTGPLALWLKPAQVKHLVRALFQNTERRAHLLSQIN